MHQTRNVLYQIKKESTKRSSPLYEPNHQQDDLREELAQTRTLLRSKDTQIMRLHSQIDDLKRKITVYQATSKISTQSGQESSENQMSGFSQIPMMFENKELKESNEILHQQNVILNGKNNLLEAQLRQLKSDMKRTETKLKELDILQKMREERFKDEVEKLTPIIVEENQDFSFLKVGVTKVANYLRDGVIQVIFQIFLRCAKEVQKQKKTNSYSIFKNYWIDLKSSKSLGFLSAVKSYESIKKLAKMLDEQYGELKQEEFRDTMNDWVLNTIIDIKHSTFVKEKEQKMFRYLGLLYRSKFPIKGQNYQLDPDVKAHFEDLLCQQILHQLLEA